MQCFLKNLECLQSSNHVNNQSIDDSLSQSNDRSINQSIQSINQYNPSSQRLRPVITKRRFHGAKMLPLLLNVLVRNREFSRKQSALMVSIKMRMLVVMRAVMMAVNVAVAACGRILLVKRVSIRDLFCNTGEKTSFIIAKFHANFIPSTDCRSCFSFGSSNDSEKSRSSIFPASVSDGFWSQDCNVQWKTQQSTFRQYQIW